MSNLESSKDDEQRIDNLSAPNRQFIDDRHTRSKLFESNNRELEQSSNSRRKQHQQTDWFSSETIQRSVLTLQFPKQWLRIGIVALAVVGGSGWFLLNRFSRPASETSTTRPIQVSTQDVTSQAIGSTQTLSGNIEPVEVVTITNRAVGKIISLPIKEGDRVKAGQLLAKIDVKDLNAQSSQATAAITQAQSGVTAAQAAATESIASASQVAAQLNQAEVGLQQAQVQVRQTQAQLRNEIAQKQSVQAELTNAQMTQQRQRMLQQQGAIGINNLDPANAQVAILQSRLQQATATIDRQSQGVAQAQASVSQAVASIKRAKAAQSQSQSQVRQARAKVNQARVRVKQAEASKSQVITNLDYDSVIAPFDGVVTRRYSEVGTMAGAGQQILTLENTSKQRFSVEVPESALAQIKRGDLVNIRLDLINQVINGKVDRLIPTANPNSHSFTIKIALPKNATLRSGMFGRVELPGTWHQGITIPTTALIRNGQTEGVYTIDRTNKAILQSVKTGKTQNGTVEIVSGLSTSDRVITSNLSQLSDGQQVVIK